MAHAAGSARAPYKMTTFSFVILFDDSSSRSSSKMYMVVADGAAAPRTFGRIHIAWELLNLSHFSFTAWRIQFS